MSPKDDKVYEVIQEHLDNLYLYTTTLNEEEDKEAAAKAMVDWLEVRLLYGGVFSIPIIGNMIKRFVHKKIEVFIR